MIALSVPRLGDVRDLLFIDATLWQDVTRTMDAEKRQALEADIRRRAEAGDLKGAADNALRGYGQEIFEFVRATHENDDDAAEVFSMFAENVWRGLAQFGWNSSFRTWAYVIARNATVTFRRRKRRDAARNVPLPEESDLAVFAADARTLTRSYLGTERRNRFVELRARLSLEEQELLILRVDRKLAWEDLAEVLHGENEPSLDPAERKRAAARLRKRFQHLKEKLYEMGVREGILEGSKRHGS